MFWTDWKDEVVQSKYGQIESAWMDGSHRSVFVSGKNLLWPNGLTIDYKTDFVYWADGHFDRIERIHMNGTNRQVCSMILCRTQKQQKWEMTWIPDPSCGQSQPKTCFLLHNSQLSFVSAERDTRSSVSVRRCTMPGNYSFTNALPCDMDFGDHGPPADFVMRPQ